MRLPSIFCFALQRFTRIALPFSDTPTSDLWTPAWLGRPGGEMPPEDGHHLSHPPPG